MSLPELYKKYEKIAKIWAPVALLVSNLKTVFIDLPTIGHKIPSGEATVMVVVLTLRIVGILLMSVYAGGPGGMIFENQCRPRIHFAGRRNTTSLPFYFSWWR